MRDSRRRATTNTTAVGEQVSISESCCRLRIQEVVSLVRVVELVTSAIAFCRQESIRQLLVDVTSLSSSIAVTLLDRFLMAEEWANEAQGAIDVAIVARPAHIDPRRFGAKTASDHGLRGNIFDAEPDALAWLQAVAEEEGRDHE